MRLLHSLYWTCSMLRLATSSHCPRTGSLPRISSAAARSLSPCSVACCSEYASHCNIARHTSFIVDELDDRRCMSCVSAFPLTASLCDVR